MQGKFLKKKIYITLGSVLVLFFLIQPFNLYCKVTKKCQPLLLSSFNWHKKGEKELYINFTAQTPDEFKNIVTFFPVESSQKIINGKNITNFYEVTNLSDEEITVRAEYSISPKKVDDYLDRIECLCFQRQVLDPKETVKMPIKFRIDSDIEKDLELKNQKEIKVNYKIDLIE